MHHIVPTQAQITKTSMSKEIRSPDFLSMSKDVEKMLGSRKQPGIQYEQGPPSSITHALQHPLKEVETSDIFGAQADSEEVRIVCKPNFWTRHNLGRSSTSALSRGRLTFMRC